MIKEPVFKKAEKDPRDYKELTFKDFIRIHNKAQEVADKIGYPVYIVGSSLVKALPRDIDIAIIMPPEEYFKRYINGPYEIIDPYYQASHFLANSIHIELNNIEPLYSLLFKGYNIDLKICPDNWFKEKEKVVLAHPRK